MQQRTLVVATRRRGEGAGSARVGSIRETGLAHPLSSAHQSSTPSPPTRRRSPTDTPVAPASGQPMRLALVRICCAICRLSLFRSGSLSLSTCRYSAAAGVCAACFAPSVSPSALTSSSSSSSSPSFRHYNPSALFDDDTGSLSCFSPDSSCVYLLLQLQFLSADSLLMPSDNLKCGLSVWSTYHSERQLCLFKRYWGFATRM